MIEYRQVRREAGQRGIVNHMVRAVCAFSILAIVSICPARAEKTITFGSPTSFSKVGRGSLVVIIPNDRGLILVSDKRTTFENGNQHDRTTKIVPINKYTLVATIGLMGFTAPGGGTGFSASESLKKYLNTIDTTGSIECYASKLEEVIERDFADYTHKVKQLPPKRPEWLSTVVHWNGKEKRFEEVSLWCRVSRTPIMRIVKAKALLTTRRWFNYAHAGAYGHVDVVDEIKHGVDRRFDEERKDKLLHEVLIKPKLASQVSQKSATIAALKIIRATNRKLSLLPCPVSLVPGLVDVGDTVDVVSLSPELGYSWEFKNQNVGSLLRQLTKQNLKGVPQ